MTTKRNMGFMFMVYLPQTKFINGSNKILIYFIDPYHSCVFAKRNYRVLVRVSLCVCVCVCTVTQKIIYVGTGNWNTL